MPINLGVVGRFVGFEVVPQRDAEGRDERYEQHNRHHPERTTAEKPSAARPRRRVVRGVILKLVPIGIGLDGGPAAQGFLPLTPQVGVGIQCLGLSQRNTGFGAQR